MKTVQTVPLRRPNRKPRALTAKGAASTSSAAQIDEKMKTHFPWALGFIFIAQRIAIVSQSQVPGLPAAANAGSQYQRLIEAAIVYVIALMTILPRLGLVTRLAPRIWPYFVFVAFAGLSAVWSSFPGEAVKFAVHCLGAYLIAVATTVACANDRRLLYLTLHWLGALIILVSVVVVFAWPAQGISQLRDALTGSEVGRWRGITATPNTLGAVAMITVWAGLAIRLHDGPRNSGLLVIGMSLFAVAVTFRGARSMTSFVCEVAMISVYWLTASRHKVKLNLNKVVLMGAAGMMVLAVMLATGLTAFDLIHRDSSLTGRTELWNFALDLIKEKPITGWSFDEDQSVLAKLGLLMPYMEFHNGYLDFAVKGGIVSAVLLIVYLFFVGRSAYRLRRIDPVSAVTTGMLLLAIILYNLAESTFFSVFDSISLPLFCVWVMNSYQLMTAAPPPAKFIGPRKRTNQAIVADAPYPSQ